MFDYKGQWFPMVSHGSPANELGSFESSHFPLWWQHLIIIVFWLLPSFCIADLEENPFYLNTWYLKDKGYTYIHYIHMYIYICPHIITDTRMYSVCSIHISPHNDFSSWHWRIGWFISMHLPKIELWSSETLLHHWMREIGSSFLGGLWNWEHFWSQDIFS